MDALKTVSMVSCATATETCDVKASDVLRDIREGRYKDQIKVIRDTYELELICTSDCKKARKVIAALKKKLAGVLWCGCFWCRGGEALDLHSGLLCVDLDELGDRLREVWKKLKGSPHVWAVFLSPSGDGLKIVFCVSADGACHDASFRAVRAHILSLIGTEFAPNFDESCKDVARLCFVSYDPDLYHNPEAVELQPLLEDAEKPKASPSNGAADLGTRQRIATELLGEIHTEADGRLFCTCPGQHLHTNPNGKRDCEVHLDGAPNIHCVHNSCRGIVDAVNHELRSRIGNAGSRVLPPIVDGMEAANLFGQQVPPELIEGVLHQGGKMVIGGGSKSFKTWVLMDLGLSVATGTEWWGIATEKGRVLYINLELQRFAFGQRQNSIASAKSVTLAPGELDIWNLRGYCADLSEMAVQIIERTQDRGYALTIIDPIYKGMGGRDENSAGDIGLLLNEIERLTVQTGAAVVFGAHFAKGNASGKESIDRISGSGVFARDPDSVITLTRHEEDGAFTVEATLRNFSPIEPFAVRWDYPLMVRDDSLDPAKLKKPKAGAASKYSVEAILDVLGLNSMKAEAFRKAVEDATGMGRATFYELFAKAKTQKKITQTRAGEWSKF